MTEVEMRRRTKAFAVRVFRLIEALPDTRSGRIIAGQLGRAGSSGAANYRAVCRAKSSPDMVSKLSTVEEEADESGLWLELVSDTGLMPADQVADLLNESGQLTAIMVASRRTLLGRNRNSKIEIRK